MITQESLKKELELVSQNQYQLPTGVSTDQILESMLAHIGVIDSQLRDDLIYSTFAEWISQDRLTQAQIRLLMTRALDEDHLFYHLGELGSDSVFTRTFSVLLLPLILDAHLRHSFLADSEIQKIYERVLEYSSREQDHRGYVAEKGWAHATAHTADALEQLALCPTLTEEHLIHLLDTVQALVKVSDEVYTHEESERLSIAVIAVFRRNLLSLDTLLRWVQQFTEPSLSGEDYLCRMAHRINRKDFLRSLYFRMRKSGMKETLDPSVFSDLQDQIEQTAAEFVRY